MTRAAPTKFRLEEWTAEEFETALVLLRIRLDVTADHFTFESPMTVAMPLHAVARRFQRGFDIGEEAIRADMLDLSGAGESLAAAGDRFEHRTRDGRWVGRVAEVEDNGQPVALAVVRTFMAAA